MATKSKYMLYFVSIIIILLILYFIVFESFSTSSMNLNVVPSLQIEPESMHKNRLIKSNSASNKAYSTYICIGDIHHKKATDRMISCHFTNLCFDQHKSHWTYYSRKIDEKQTAKDIIYDNFDELMDDFWDEFLLFRHNPPTYWRPYIEYKAAPNDYKTKWFINPTVYHFPFVLNNFGHCLGDNFYTIWHILDIFEQYSSRMLLLLHYNGLLEHNSSINNILKIYPYIMEKMPLILNPDNKYKTISTVKQNEQYEPYNTELSQYEMFCFKDIYIGTTSIRLQRSSSKPYEWNRFIYNQFLNNNKHYQIYNKYMRLSGGRKQKVLFLNKTLGDHRRFYANDITNVCKYISDLFDIEIDILSDKDLIAMSLEEQINVILEYTILITPCGSLAFLGVFMREGSAMITMDWYNRIFNMSSHLESYLWEFESRKKTYYYYVTLDDVVKRIEDDVVKSKRISFHDVALHWSDYIIRPKRLATYVHSALVWVENYNGWKNTFDKPKHNWLLDSTNHLSH